MRIWNCLAFAVAAICAGCVALTSEIADEGVVYYLPKSILTIAVWEYHDTKTSNTWYQIGGITEKEDEHGAAVSKIPTVPTYTIYDETVPDPEHRYAIRYNPSAASDERLCISRSATGLLHDVQFASDDRTPKIAFNIARFLAGAVPAPTGFRSATTTADDVRTRSYSAKVDPFNRDDIAAFNAALRNMFRAPLAISFDRALDLIRPAKNAWPKGCTDSRCMRRVMTERCKPEHICYRTKVTLPIELKLDDQVVDVNYANVINAWDFGAVSVTRAFMVHKISKFKFDNGALVAAVIRKPSELEELSLLPINIINAALITPSGMWVAALSGSTQQKDQVLNDIANLSEKVNTLQDKVSGVLEQGVGPTLNNGEQDTYKLECKGTSPKGLINLFGSDSGDEP
jgi:hypothetical protein